MFRMSKRVHTKLFSWEGVPAGKSVLSGTRLYPNGAAIVSALADSKKAPVHIVSGDSSNSRFHATYSKELCEHYG